MSATILLNDATREQLKVLLQLKPDELTALTEARPIASWHELNQLLPARSAMVAKDLTVAKFPLNHVDRVTLTRAAGLTLRDANAVMAARPFFLDAELLATETVSHAAAERVLSYFTVGQFRYFDKSSGKDISLDPKTDEFVALTDSESGNVSEAIESAIKFRVKSTSGQRRRYSLIVAADAEGGLAAMRTLRRDALAMKSFPCFTDSSGARRYFDPEYLFVQFGPDTPEERQQEIFRSLGLTVEDKFRTPGLFTVRQIAAATDAAAAMRTIAALNEFPAVRLVEPAYLSFDDLETGDTPAGMMVASGAESAEAAAGSTAPWHLAMIHAPDAWTITKGLPQIVIVLIDTGVDSSHPLLINAILPRPTDERWNFVPNEGSDPADTQGHGTFVAGVLVGDGSDSVVGICPGCRLLPLKVPLQGSASSYGHRRDAILFAASQANASRRIILNISWKTEGDVALIRDAMEQASERGCLIVCSAGNWPTVANEPHYPSDYTMVVSTGAVGENGQRADYSFFGDNVDIAAPGGSSTNSGRRISSAAIGGGTRQDFGTSFAAPQVAGAAALVWSAAINSNAAQVRDALETTATRLVAEGLGSGLVNCGEAAITIDGRAPVPPLSSDPLIVLNTFTVDQLVGTFGLFIITARLIVNRRPIARAKDIQGTLGLSEGQYARLVGIDDAKTGEQINVNMATFEELATIPGMPVFTARLIVINRPFTNPARISNILGMTPVLLDHLSV